MSIDFFFTKVRPVKSPTRGTAESAGIDFFVPDDFNETEVRPGSSTLIPSGIKCAYPPGYALILFNKSGIATKYKLTSLACVCDSDYQGEIHISLINVGKDSVKITPGMKIAQFILVPISLVEPKEIGADDELWDLWSKMSVIRSSSESTRGDGGFGSTGEF
jgi:dUTP pyrophosphatase